MGAWNCHLPSLTCTPDPSMSNGVLLVGLRWMSCLRLGLEGLLHIAYMAQSISSITKQEKGSAERLKDSSFIGRVYWWFMTSSDVPRWARLLSILYAPGMNSCVQASPALHVSFNGCTPGCILGHRAQWIPVCWWIALSIMILQQYYSYCNISIEPVRKKLPYDRYLIAFGVLYLGQAPQSQLIAIPALIEVNVPIAPLQKMRSTGQGRALCVVCSNCVPYRTTVKQQ